MDELFRARTVPHISANSRRTVITPYLSSRYMQPAKNGIITRRTSIVSSCPTLGELGQEQRQDDAVSEVLKPIQPTTARAEQKTGADRGGCDRVR